MMTLSSIPQDRFARGVNSMLIGLFSNVLLAATKITAGILGNSYALIADGIESTMDIFSSVVVLGGIKISSLPADENHPYGHGRAESLAAMIASMALLMAGIGIAAKSIIEIINKTHHTPAFYTLIVLVVSSRSRKPCSGSFFTSGIPSTASRLKQRHGTTVRTS